MSRAVLSTALNTAPSAAATPLHSLYRRADELVLQAVPLKPGEDPAAGSRFADDQWNLAPAQFRENLRRMCGKLDFTTIADAAQRLTAKEYLWARLNERPPAGTHRRRLSPTAAHATLHHLKLFVHFVGERCGRFNMSDVDQTLLDTYLVQARSGKSRSAYHVAIIISPVIDLHRHAQFLTLGGFACRPWADRAALSIAGYAPQTGQCENRTARIPEVVMAALLPWALRYVEIFSADIFAAREELNTLQRVHATRSRRIRGQAATVSIHARLDSFIEQRFRAGRGIPLMSSKHIDRRRTGAATGEPKPNFNFTLIAQHIGCDRSVVRTPHHGFLARLIDAMARLGGEIGGLDTPITILEQTGRPWRERFDAFSLAHEERMLQAACYIVCAYLTGMRDSEVQAMLTGCHSVTRSADGLIERHRIVSRVYKGYGASGLQAQWITIAPVGRAIAVLEQLTELQRTRRRSGTLWQALGNGARSRTALGDRSLYLVNRFRAHLDRTYGSCDTPAIPHVDGQPWHFTLRQFRRTVAWYIANRPFGTVAGKIQYQHASIAMFEGYAGESTTGFRREIEQERALGQLEDIVEHYEDFRRGLKPTGPASARVLGEFEHIQQELDDFPGRIVDRQRLRAMLAHLGRSLHVGLLNDCFFEPATALCLDRSGTADRSTPRLSHCTPDRCPNSCLAARHLPPWERSIAETHVLLKDTRLSSLQRKTLTDDQARMQRLIAPLKERIP